MFGVVVVDVGIVNVLDWCFGVDGDELWCLVFGLGDN